LSRVLLLFLDGVGVGPDDPDRNPFSTAALPAWSALLHGRRVVLEEVAGSDRLLPLDASLGVAGRPQSGTGQTALLTGVNAPALLGRHLGPYPAPELRPLLARRSLWSEALRSGRTAAYANAFPDRFLERVARGSARMGAIARAALLAGVRLRGPGDLAAGRAVSAFLTNEGWRDQLGYEGLPMPDEAEAGASLARLAADHDLTLFEYFATDIAGHRGDAAEARRTLERFDRFLWGLLRSWSGDDVLVLASDHGNLEDMGRRGHTGQPALGIWHGPPPPRPLAALTDVAPAVLGALGLSAA
jgi:hypothetical protein